MKINEYLDKCKSTLNITSDAKFGEHLGLTRSAVSIWRTGRSAPDDYACFQIANILNIDPRKVIADARLEVEKNKERKEFWKETSLEYGYINFNFVVVILTVLVLAQPIVFNIILSMIRSVNNTYYAHFLIG